MDLTRAEVALLTGRVDDARRLAGRARDRFRRHGNDRWRRAAELVLLHADLAAGRPAARLLPHATRLADEFAEAGFPAQTRTALLLAAELELDLGRPAEAGALLDAVGQVGETDPIAVRLHRRLVQAEILELEGRLPQARRQVARGLRDLAAYQAQFGGIDLQSASAVHGRRLAAHDLDLALRSGRPGSVVAAVERSRAVSGRIRSVTPPADERTAELLAELRRTVDEASTASVSGPGADRHRAAADRRAPGRAAIAVLAEQRQPCVAAAGPAARSAGGGHRGRLRSRDHHPVPGSTGCGRHPRRRLDAAGRAGRCRDRTGMAAAAVRRSGRAGQRRAAAGDERGSHPVTAARGGGARSAARVRRSRRATARS